MSIYDVGRGMDQREAAGLKGWMQYSALPPAGLGRSLTDTSERPQRLREHPDSTESGNKMIRREAGPNLKYHQVARASTHQSSPHSK